MVSVFAAFAGNTLEVVRTTTNTLEVQLMNSEDVAGLQFSLRTSSDIVLGDLDRCARTAESHWMVASYKPNDSTINVMILSLERKNFSGTQGTLVKIPFSMVNSLEKSKASFTDVMITNTKADSLGVTINNLEWNNNSTIAAKNNESKSFLLGQNYPNPFNPSTRITYQLNKAAQVQLSVFDMTGREVKRLVDRYQYVGEYSVEWNSSTNSGQKLASGMYFACLTVDNESTSQKMVLTK
jgi:hypothetical protein